MIPISQKKRVNLRYGTRKHNILFASIFSYFPMATSLFSSCRMYSCRSIEHSTIAVQQYAQIKFWTISSAWISEELDWKLASLRYPLATMRFVPQLLERLSKEDILELRRRGRIFLERLDNAEGISLSLLCVESEGCLSEESHIYFTYSLLARTGKRATEIMKLFFLYFDDLVQQIWVSATFGNLINVLQLLRKRLSQPYRSGSW